MDDFGHDLHRLTLTLDSHIDIPWPNPPDPFEPSQRRVDMLKMARGGLGAGCFVAYVPQGPLTTAGWEDARARAEAMLQAIHGMARTANGVTARITTSVAEIADARRDGAIAIIPALENGHSIGQDLSQLARFRAMGARYMTLTHNGHNALADSSNPRADLNDAPTLHGGLSGLGREAIAEMNRLGMVVDVSHTSKATMLQAASLSRTPVVATHSCMHALCAKARNLDDEQLDVLRDTGGVVQITAVAGFLRADIKPEQVTVADYVDHLDYAVRRCGVAHVGISSDFDGGGALSGWADASQSANMTAELIRRGYDPAAIAALWGGNFLRVMAQAEAEAAKAAV